MHILSSKVRIGTVILSALMIGLLSLGRGLANLQGLESLRVTIAFALFLLPGGCLAYLINGGKRWSWARFVAYGLPISYVLNGVLTNIARTLQYNVETITLWHIVISIALLFFVFNRVDFSFVGKLPKPKPITIISLIAVVICLAIFIYFSTQQRYDKFNPIDSNLDALTYYSEVTYYAQASALDWSDIYFDTGARISDRYYFAAHISAQSLIVYLSGIHILQAQFAIHALLFLIGGCIFYVVARHFGYSPKASLWVVLVWILVLTLLTETRFEVGSQVISRLLQDKLVAGFLLASIVFGWIHTLLQRFSKRSLLLFALVLAGVQFAHPMIMGFVVVTIGLWMIFTILTRWQFKSVFLILIVTGVVFSPSILIRLSSDTVDNYNSNYSIPDKSDFRVWVNDDNTLYAISSDPIGNALYILLAVTGILTFIRLRHDHISRFLFAIVCCVGIGIVPQTAFIYGKLVSLMHMLRVIWIIPFGLMAVYMIERCYELILFILQRVNHDIPKTVYVFGITIAIVLSPLYVWQTMSANIKIAGYVNLEEAIHINDELIEIADYVDTVYKDNRILIMGDRHSRNVITALTRSAMTLTHFTATRMNRHSEITLDEANYRREANLQFFTPILNNDERYDVLTKYNVQYILYNREINDQWMDPMLNQFPNSLNIAYETPQYRLIEVLDYMVNS